MGEQIRWSPWGTALSIVRVEKPLETHYEWSTYLHIGNFAGIKRLLATDCVYYLITHCFAPEKDVSQRNSSNSSPPRHLPIPSLYSPRPTPPPLPPL